MNETWTRRIRIARRVTLLIGILNFVVFVALATYLGGDAVNGKTEGGRYYLYGPRKSGGKGYTEVSQQVFTYSKWHVYSIFATWPFVMAVAFVEARNRKRQQTNRKKLWD